MAGVGAGLVVCYGEGEGGSCSGCAERFQGFAPNSEQRTGRGRCQQSELARSLASLTLFSQSPPQRSRAPSSATLCFETLPVHGTVSTFCFFVCFMFYCSSSYVSSRLSERWQPAAICLQFDSFFVSKRSKTNLFPL